MIFLVYGRGKSCAALERTENCRICTAFEDVLFGFFLRLDIITIVLLRLPREYAVVGFYIRRIYSSAE